MTHPNIASNPHADTPAPEGTKRSTYVYFVAFAHPGAMGFGNAEVKLPEPITRFEQVGMLQSKLQASGGLQSVVIQNYILLRVDEGVANA